MGTDIDHGPSHHSDYGKSPVVEAPKPFYDTLGPGSTFTDPVTGMRFVWTDFGWACMK
nr:hypothetical protein [uncultured Desulfobacter sp.]